MNFDSIEAEGLPAATVIVVKFITLAAARLREAMNRPLSPERVAVALCEACAGWRDRGYATRRETVAAIAAAWGWSDALVDESIDALLAPFSAAALENLALRTPHQSGAASNDAANPRRSGIVGLILPGNLPGAGIHEIAIGLIAGRALMVKTATAEPIFFVRFVQTLREVDAEVAARIEVMNWSRERVELTASLRANCAWIAAFGDDETIARLGASAQYASVEASASPEETGAGNLGVGSDVGNLAVGFGSRVSGVLVAKEMVGGADAVALTDVLALADGVARDVSLFEQQGCLSPHHIFVESAGLDARIGAGRAFARELAAALERCAHRMPSPRRYGLEEAAKVRRVREAARWRAIGGGTVELWEGSRLGWTVVWDEVAVFTPSPGYRTVTVSPIRDFEDLKQRLKPVMGRIEAFAIAAPAAARERWHAALSGLGICYLCEPGAMQSPPLDWSHGGGAFMRALATMR